jgi:hypothetical protein
MLLDLAAFQEFLFCKLNFIGYCEQQDLIPVFNGGGFNVGSSVIHCSIM